MSAKLQSLIVSYSTTLPSNVQAVAQCLSPSTDSADAICSNLADALDRVHRIKGAAGSLGFEAISRAAAELETHLKAMNNTGAVDNGGGHRLALESLAQLENLAANVRPEGSRLYGIDLSRILSQARGLAIKP